MDKLTRQAENEKFHEWYLKSGYHFHGRKSHNKPKTDEEGDWVVTVRYWAWKAWEERASMAQNEELEEHIGELV